MSMANMLKSPGWKGTEQMIPWLPFGLHCWQNSTAQELCNNGGLKRVQGDVIQSDLCQALSLKGINSPGGFPDVGSSCSLLQLDGNKTLKGIEGLRLYRQKQSQHVIPKAHSNIAHADQDETWIYRQTHAQPGPWMNDSPQIEWGTRACLDIFRIRMKILTLLKAVSLKNPGSTFCWTLLLERILALTRCQGLQFTKICPSGNLRGRNCKY